MSSKLEVFKNRAKMKALENRSQLRAVVSGGEMLAGAFASGVIAEQFGTVAGVPADAALGITLVVAGVSLNQKDTLAVGLGFIAGYVRDLGRDVGANGVIPILKAV